MSTKCKTDFIIDRLEYLGGIRAEMCMKLTEMDIFTVVGVNSRDAQCCQNVKDTSK